MRWWPTVLAWMVLTAVVGVLGVDVWQARGLNHLDLEARKGFAREFLGPVDRPITLAPSPGETHARIWLFGASSFAAPDRVIVPEGLVARAQAAGHTWVVDNLAWEGLTSWQMVHRQGEALDRADAEGIRPDVMMVYSGHNDVTTTYHGALGFPAADRWAFPASALVSLPSWVWYNQAAQFPEGDGFRFYRNWRVGSLLRRYQQVGLVRYEASRFDPLHAQTRRVYAEEAARFLGRAAERGVPVVWVTPLGAVGFRPMGPIQQTDRLYDQAMAEPDYDRRMALLFEARDAETFHPTLRVKSSMIEDIRGMGPDAKAGPAPVSVCDIERAFLEAQVPMGEETFLDPVHFSPEGFERLMDELFRCLVAGPLRGPAHGEAPQEDETEG